MPIYVTLYKFTDQGIRNVKDTVKRAEAIKQASAKAGVTVKELYWVQGQYDAVGIAETSDEATGMAMALTVAKGGNVTSQTMRAFTAAEMEAILAKVT